MARARHVLTAGVSLAAHGGAAALLLWLLSGERPETQRPLTHIVAFDLPLPPVAPSRSEREKKPFDKPPSAQAPRSPSIRWPSIGDVGVAAALGAFARLDCWHANDRTDIEDCLYRLARDPEFERERRWLIKAGVENPDLIAIAMRRGWIARPTKPPDRERLLAVETDKSFRDELAERNGPSPIPGDPYQR